MAAACTVGILLWWIYYNTATCCKYPRLACMDSWKHRALLNPARWGLVYLHNVAEGMVDSVNNSWVLEFIWEKLVKKDVLSVLWFFFSLSDCGRNESRLCGSKCDVGRGKLRYISTLRKFGSNLINCLCMSFNLQWLWIHLRKMWCPLGANKWYSHMCYLTLFE